MSGKLILSFIAVFVLLSLSFVVSVEADSSMWSQTYGGTGNDVAHSLVATSDGGYAIAGYTTSFGAGNGDYWLVKTDAAGNMQWNRTYGGTAMEEARSVVETSDGGYAIAGNTDGAFWLVKTDASGNMEWNKIYSGSHWTPLWFLITCSMVATADGGYALAGYVTSFGAEYNDFWLIKTDTYGNMEWNRTYGGTVHSLIQTSDGGYALAGYTNAGGTRFLLVKTDELGYMEWNQTYELGSYCNSLIVTSDGGYALAGTKNGDFWLVKTDEFGVVPEYSSWVLLSIMLVATFVIVIYKKKFFDDHP